MRIPRLQTAVAAAFLAALLAGCDSSTEVRRDPREGSVSFTYSGHSSGSYAATGVPPAPGPVSGTYSAGYSTAAGYVVSSVATRAAPAGDRFVIELRGPPGPGTFTTGACPANDGEVRCLYSLVLIVNFRPGGSASDPGRLHYSATDGTLTIERVSQGRIRGTFSGHAQTREGHVTDISNGRFDVALDPYGPQSVLSLTPARRRARALVGAWSPVL